MDKKNKIVAISGNKSAAIGAALSKPDLIAAYPITPQSSVVEALADMIANGELDSTMVHVESEHSAMSVVQGAAVAGGRTFTATSAQGLALMFEPYFRMSTLRLPMVMAIATREMTSPETVWSGQQDAVTVRDAGWIQMFAENNQEILDMVIQGYKLAEHKDVLLPVNVCYDGFYLSHLTERVEIPSQELADEFLGSYSCNHVTLDPDKPMAVDPLTSSEILWRYRKSHLEAMQNALEVIDEVDIEFDKVFGRKYGGAIDTYKIDDAELVIVTMGATTGTARVAVDKARDMGYKIGLLKVRFLRPFPSQRIKEVLNGKKAYAVIDKSVSFGWNTGVLYNEIKSAVSDLDRAITSMPAIGGLGGADISVDMLLDCIKKLDEESKNYNGQLATYWFE